MQIKLYELRKKAGLTQAQMAKKLDISENSYRMKELGRTDFKSTEMFIIADVLKHDINEIFLPKKTTKRLLSGQPS
ncbi:DNA-binding transcriptional regulator, XRE-family HTH domain [Streptococcus henryi]|uniref:DNA-binding transcriptional regulator, XRE-family HTH domain n=1 Tax=Streptococcus henryi TaxID=439219 RepID=A0A1G6AKW8_9STRE|nr:helix-turn-helix transcriptional regulator [Streptococcus henryi]QBX25350.1 repressor [Streptococcus phage Javan252]SDB09047.1 DNA-binding transcriptional regulator, XRE-family HTH domain [Streptococcus henryi]